jgi:tetratricopeptide (TPR) repeat protein
MANRARTQTIARREREEVEINPLDTIQAFYEDKRKIINTATTILVLVVGGYLAYSFLYKKPREEKASTAMYYPQLFFQFDSLNLAINGDGQHPGFSKIIKKYDGTDAANLSQFYTGACYLQMGNFANAIKYFQAFNGRGTMLGNQAWGCLGMAYLETGNAKKAIEYFNKAAGDKDDNMLTPLYLYHAGLAYEANRQPKEAIKVFRRIRDEYPKSMQARTIDLELAQLGDVSE